MANIRTLVNRRRAVRNIRKITRTMELIATSRFQRAMKRASPANLTFHPTHALFRPPE